MSVDIKLKESLKATATEKMRNALTDWAIKNAPDEMTFAQFGTLLGAATWAARTAIEEVLDEQQL